MKSKLSKSANTTISFEQALATDVPPRYVLRLYVAGMTPRSSRAITNAKAICETHLEGRYDLSVIDVYQEPVHAVNDQIVGLPVLVKELPKPVRRIVGDLADTDRALVALDLKPRR
jgi:circadian clock protein KaiB